MPDTIERRKITTGTPMGRVAATAAANSVPQGTVYWLVNGLGPKPEAAESAELQPDVGEAQRHGAERRENRDGGDDGQHPGGEEASGAGPAADTPPGRPAAGRCR
ncbi:MULTISPECIES: hypothetical protein [Streptomyces]|nr:hypothetical protein [Streptomyces nigrescens]MEE4422763.1 hypothetical protein [Streptomyces sp. DSM 41528]